MPHSKLISHTLSGFSLFLETLCILLHLAKSFSEGDNVLRLERANEWEELCGPTDGTCEEALERRAEAHSANKALDDEENLTDVRPIYLRERHRKSSSKDNRHISRPLEK